MRARFALGLAVSVCFAGILAFAVYRLVRPTLPELPASCALSPAPADDLLVVATAQRGAILSNVLIGSPNDSKPDAAMVVDINVGPGAKPITVLVAGDGRIIWQFEGDTARVRRVVALARDGGQRVAVGGIPKDRIEFIARERCQTFAQATEPASNGDLRVQKRALAFMFGRPVDHVTSAWQPRALVLPEARFATSREPQSPPGVGASAGERAMNQIYPGGSREIDPTTLVSPLALSIPPVKPAELGLVELERNGSIRPPRPEEVAEFAEAFSRRYRSKLSPDYRVSVRFNYVITRPIALPVGLYGARMRSFLVLNGVPPPQGDRAHSCIAHMDGFLMEDATACLGRFGYAIDKFPGLPDPKVLKSCRVWEPPANASLEGISIRGGGDERSGMVRPIAPAAVTVRVEKPGDVVLVLNAYKAIAWHIEPSASTHIAGVVVIGHERGVVSGLPDDTPVQTLSMRQAADHLRRQEINGACFAFHQYLTGGQGGAEAMTFDRQVELLTGRKLDGLISALRLSEAMVR